MRFLDAAGVMKREKRNNPQRAIPRKERKAKEEAAKAAGDDWVRLLGPRLSEREARTLRGVLADWELGRGARTAVVVGTVGLVGALAAWGIATGGARTQAPVERARLGEAPPAGPPRVSLAPHDRGVIAIASSPPGAAIFVNGELTAETTPVTFVHAAIGAPYVISLAADGFDAASRTIALTGDDPSGALSVVLEASRPRKAR